MNSALLPRHSVRARLVLALCCAVLGTGLAGPARAQSGVLDQEAPLQSNGFTILGLGSPVLVWQQQVRPGRTGILEGFELHIEGGQGALVRAAIRVGPAYNHSPILYEATLAKPTNGTDVMFWDASAAGVVVDPALVFVIEVQGLGLATTTVARGSHVSPPGAPLYPEPLYRFDVMTACYGDCQSRFAFRTYVLEAPPPVAYCSGDGTAAACPCGNSSAAGANVGCLSSLGQGGKLSGSGYPGLTFDRLVLTGAQMPNSSALYFQGTQAQSGGAGVAFGDGLRCVGGSILRLGTKSNMGGTSSYPGGSDLPISVRGAVATPGSRWYQVWYRNAASFCTPSTFNLTNGLRVTWEP